MTRHAESADERLPIEITDLTVARARRGDHAAIGALGGAAFRRIVAFYRYTGVDPDAAEDLAADAVEQIITKLPTLRDVNAYDAWMWTITRNLLRDHWRRGKVGDPVEPITPAPPGPEELTVIREDHADIRAALRTLPLRDRELLWLREIIGLDYRSIAERTGTSPATARVACHRARGRLQRAYEKIERESRS
jgi:RNA polymerase sigma-70 factor, ECF subfamily